MGEAESYSFEEVERLVSSVELDEAWGQVTFESDCGESIRTVPISLEELGRAVPAARAGGLRGWVYGRLRGVLGKEQSGRLSAQERRRLILVAFERFQPMVKQVDGRWVRRDSEEHPTELFDRLVRAAPISDSYELEILRRLLSEISAADGEEQLEERELLEDLFGSSYEADGRAPFTPVTVAELAELRALPVRRIVLMLCWAMAYADGRIESEESAALWKISQGFQLPAHEIRKLQNGAKLFLLDRAYEEARRESSPEGRERLRRRVERLGFEGRDLERFQAWYPSLLDFLGRG